MDDTKGKVAMVGGSEAGYLFEFKADGVFLTVYPHAGSDILFELADMRKVLTDYGVADYDIETLAKTVRAADGNPAKLAEHFVLPPDVPCIEDLGEDLIDLTDDRPEMTFQLVVSRDRMTVTVKINRQPNQKPPSVEKVQQALAALKVTHGIDLEAIVNNVENSFEFVAARGTPPVNGNDAVINRKYSLAEKGRPAHDKYDQVDYKNMNLFTIAKKGQVLVERVPNTPGTPGTNIFGEEVRPKPGKPKQMPTGKNTELRDENTLVAAIDGQIIEKGNKIEIDPQLFISGDVGVGTGNINFVGAVDVRGNVQKGFEVNATGDVHIDGMVNGGTVKGCNIYIRGGVQGVPGSNSGIYATGEVQVAFTENAIIEAGSNITVFDVALHSELKAGRVLAVEGKRGLITGGYLAAGEEIRAKNIGNLHLVSSKLVVGVNPMLQQKYQEVCRDYAETKQKLSQLTKTLNTLGKLDISTLPPNRAQQISALMRSQFPMAARVEQDERQIRELEEQIANMRKGRVKVAEKMYPGTKLIINSIMKNVQEEYQHCELSVVEGEIRAGLYF